MDNYLLYDGDLTVEDKKRIFSTCVNIAIDTETTGLNPNTDKLCLIQVYTGKETFLLKFNEKKRYSNLIEILESNKIIKVFHNANFDVRFLISQLNIINIKNTVCTKIAAKILNGLNEKNSLYDLLFKYLNIKIDKSLQTSDWSKQKLTDEQIMYAVNDTKYLFSLWSTLKEELEKKELLEYAQRCYDFLPTQAYLQNKGIDNIFAY